MYVDDSENFSYAFWYSVFLGHVLGAQLFELLFEELQHQLSLDAFSDFQRLHEYEGFLGLTKWGVEVSFLTECLSFRTILLCQLQQNCYWVIAPLTAYLDAFHPVSSKKEACVPLKYVILDANKNHEGVLHILFLHS